MARRVSRVNTDEEDVELNMTPMLDVVFILLIFFIVTSVFIKEPGVEVERPEAVITSDERPTMLVAVTGDNEIFINRRVYEQAQVRGVIEQLMEENPRAEAVIQGDQDADIVIILDVQELLGELGVEVKISTVEP